ncbi:MAG: transcriptional regulator [Nitrospirae bacterium]|nr:MAG: transcriptional regulator [Nitrospirota bacterium]
MTTRTENVFSIAEKVLGCKWMLQILHHISKNVNRPSALERAIPGLTTKVLNERLRTLLRFGILEKNSFRESPPRVEYRLTRFGRRLVSILEQLEALQHEIARSNSEQRRSS